jgi:hypothetical protein
MIYLMISVLQNEMHVMSKGHKYWLNHFQNKPAFFNFLL